MARRLARDGHAPSPAHGGPSRGGRRVTYLRRASPLHAARAGVAAAWCVAVGLVALSLEQPGVLGAVLAAVLLAALGAHVGRQVGVALAWGLPFALVIALVNALVTRDGLTVL